VDQAVRLLIVDDHPEIRKALRRLLAAHWDVCGEAADGVEAIEVARETHPSLVFLDVDMPRLNGIETCRQLRQDDVTAGAGMGPGHAGRACAAGTGLARRDAAQPAWALALAARLCGG